MRKRDLPMGPHRPPQENPLVPQDRGIRHLKIGVGGGFEMTCLAMMDDVKAMGLDGLVKVMFIDTDANNLEYLHQSVKLILNDVRAADLLEAIKEFPERFPGWEILGDLEEKWQALGAAESLPAGLMTRRELGALVLVYVLWRKPSLVRNFLLSSARELAQGRPQRLLEAQQRGAEKASPGGLLLLQQLRRHRFQLLPAAGGPPASFAQHRRRLHLGGVRGPYPAARSHAASGHRCRSHQGQYVGLLPGTDAALPGQTGRPAAWPLQGAAQTSSLHACLSV